MTDLTAVDLFAGVGGFHLALQGAGVEVAATAEIDDLARGVLAHRFPNMTHMTDVCEVTGDRLRAAGFVPERGILTAGWPCTDLSIAGRRAGLAGERSSLFWEVVRLLDETRSRFFVLENVPGLLSSNGGRDMGAVVGALVERGYGIAWRVLDSQFFGTAQRRRRLVFVGHLGDDGRASAEVLALAQGLRGDSDEIDAARSHDASSLGTRVARDGLTARGVEEGERIAGAGTGIVGTVSSKWAKGTGGPSGDEVYNIVVKTFVKGRRAQSAEHPETWREDDISPTLNLFDNNSESRATVIITDPPRRLTPLECERLQGFPDDWTRERVDFKTGAVVQQSDSARYKQMGNAVAVPVFNWVIGRLVAWATTGSAEQAVRTA